MVYRRRYTGRRTTRSRRRTLSSYNLATRTSARAQARQIYALNRKINVIQRRTKPEILTTYINTVTRSKTPTEGTQGTLLNYVPTPGQDSENGGPNIEGQFCRQLGLTGYFSARYNTMSTGNSPVCFRLVGIQLRATRDGGLNPNDVFNGVGTSFTDISTDVAQNAFNGPLTTGLARIAKVLFDKKYYLSYQRPQISTKIKTRRLLNYYKASTESSAKGQIVVYLLAYSLGTTPYSYDYNYKLAYTDS